MKENQHNENITERVPAADGDQAIQEPLPPVKKSALKRWKWPLLILVIAIVIASVAAIYFLTRAATEKQAVKAPSFASSQKAVDTVTAQIDEIPLTTTSLNGLGGATQDNYLIWDLPFYQVEGNKFSNAPTEGVGKGYAGNSIDATRQFTTLSSFFEKHEYKEIEKESDFKGYLSYSQPVIFNDYRIYEADNMLCAVSHIDATDSLLKNHVASVGCAEKASYTSAAKALQPFYTAYSKGKAELSSGELVFGNPIVKSGSDGYQNAALYQEDPTQVVPDGEPNFFQGLYYKASGDSEWTYVTSMREVADCSAFGSDVLKKAFQGMTCYDTVARKNKVI